MIETFFDGLLLVLQWPALGFLVVGVLAGIWMGAVPGLTGIVGMVMVLPFTFGMDPVAAFTLLLALYAVTTTGDTLSAVLLGVPGTAASSATVLDGYPLAQKGQAQRAFGAAFTVSAIGGILGGLILAVSLPLIRPLILSFGSPEFFMLGLLGLTMVGALSGTSLLKGLVSAGLGLMISMIGYAPAVGTPRYWFGQIFLLEGIPLVAVVLGLFAVTELMELAIRNRSIARVDAKAVEGGGMLDGVRDAFRHRWLVLRCSFIGIYIGMLPGLGAAIVDWVAYGHTVQSSKDKSRFGSGDIRGVIGPESANNAVRGGALIPTVAFGIPGSASMAILLGALLIQGLRPGQQMLTDKLDLTFSMVWTIILANILAALILMAFSKQISRLAFIPGHLLVPGAIVLVFMGAWQDLSNIGGWWILCMAGLLGVWMKHSGWPRPPMLLGIVLGPIMEHGYLLSNQAFPNNSWMLRPWVLVISAVIVMTLISQIWRQFSGSRGGDAQPESGEGVVHNPVLSLPLSMLALGVVAAAAVMAQSWPTGARVFPMTVAVPCLLLLVPLTIRDAMALRADTSAEGGLAAAWRRTSQETLLHRVALFLSSLAGMVLFAWLIGLQVALPLYVGVYLLVTRHRWYVAVGYAVCAWAVQHYFYGILIGTFWQPGLLWNFF